MTIQMIIVLLTLLMFIVMILSGKVKIHVAALLIPIILEITQVLGFKEAWGGMLNSSIVMMASMFIVGAAINKTSLLSRMSKTLIKPGASDLQIMIGIAVPILFLGCFINGTGTMTIMIPLITGICAEHKRPLSKFMFPALIIIQLWNGFLPTGGNAGSYLTQNALIENLGGVGTYTYFSTFISKIPFVLILIPCAIFLTLKMAPDHGNIPTLEQVSAAEEAEAKNKKKYATTLTPGKEIFTIVIFVSCIIGIVSCALLGISTWYPSTIAATLLVFGGVLNDKEAIKAMTAPVIFVSIGTLPLATALNKTGTDAFIADNINRLFGASNPMVIMMVIYFCVMILTQFMSDSAANNAFKTLAALIAVQNGYDPRSLMFASSLGAANSYLLPTGSIPQVMATEVGGYSVKDTIRMAMPLTIINIIIFVLYIPRVFPFY